MARDQKQLKKSEARGIYFRLESIVKGNQSENSKQRTLEAGAETQTMEASHLLAHLHAYTQLPFLDSPNPPAKGWHCTQWTGPFYINHWSRKCHTDAHTPISWRQFFSQPLLRCIKLTKNNQQMIASAAFILAWNVPQRLIYWMFGPQMLLLFEKVVGTLTEWI